MCELRTEDARATRDNSCRTVRGQLWSGLSKSTLVYLRTVRRRTNRGARSLAIGTAAGGGCLLLRVAGWSHGVGWH